jgi:hypothetical protein
VSGKANPVQGRMQLGLTPIRNFALMQRAEWTLKKYRQKPVKSAVDF